MKGKCKINAFRYSQEASLNEKALSKLQVNPLVLKFAL
jgi:hypothetical protein